MPRLSCMGKQEPPPALQRAALSSFEVLVNGGEGAFCFMLGPGNGSKHYVCAWDAVLMARINAFLFVAAVLSVAALFYCVAPAFERASWS